MSKIHQNRGFCIGYHLTENFENQSKSKMLYKVNRRFFIGYPLTENVKNRSKSRIFHR
eukprot:UN03090